MFSLFKKPDQTPFMQEITFALVLALVASLFYLGARQVMIERQFLAAQNEMAEILENLSKENAALKKESALDGTPDMVVPEQALQEEPTL
jgi:hypothetical protein